MQPFPKIKPLTLTRVSQPFDDPEWVFELKHDGFRAVAYLNHGNCELFSRNGNRFKRFPSLQSSLAELRVENAVLDGEVVCLDSEGRSVFNDVLFGRGTPAFYAFDLMWLDSQDLRPLPLLSRKRLLERLILSNKNSRALYADHIEGNGKDFFHLICEKNLEGIVAKHGDAPYSESAKWRKIKNPTYTGTEGRKELFEAFRPPSKLIRTTDDELRKRA